MSVPRPVWSTLVVSAMVGSAVGVGATLFFSTRTFAPSSSSGSSNDLLRRLQRLESTAASLGDRLESSMASLRRSMPDHGDTDPSSSERSEPSPFGDVAARLDLLETRLTLLQRTVDDQLARNAIAIAGVQRRVEGAAALDESEREQIRRDIEDENRLVFERRLGELRTASQGVRSKWIGDVSGELGLTDVQCDRIVQIYESQAARWAEIFERIQRESMSPGDSVEALRSLRRETDGKLREFLSVDQLTRFREVEARRFSNAVPR